MRAIIFATLAPAMFIAGCNQPPADTPADPADVLAAIDAVEQGQQAAFNADDLEGATSVYATDARFFDAGGAPAVGAEAIRAAFEGMFADPNAALSLTRTQSWVAESGDLAVTTSDYTLTVTGDDGQPVTISGVNQTLWQKQADGSWKIAADFNGGTGDSGSATAAE